LLSTLNSISNEQLWKISTNMHEFNLKQEKLIKGTWLSILEKIKNHKIANSNYSTPLPLDINDAMQLFYGKKISNECYD
jgi:hypothetical protein